MPPTPMSPPSAGGDAVATARVVADAGKGLTRPAFDPITCISTVDMHCRASPGKDV